MKKLLAILLSALLVVALIPTAVFATGQASGTGTTISGQLNLSSLTDSDSDDGWSWNADSKTLTLTNLTITSDGKYRSAIVLPADADGDTITIVLEGDNYISSFDQTSGRAFVVGYDANASSSGDLTLTGDGSLTISDCGWVQNGSFTNVIIDNTTITAETVSGWTVGGTLTIQDSDVTINATGTYNALYAVESITIIDSTVTASAPNSSNAVIATQNTRSSGTTEAAFVIENSTIIISGGLGWGLWCDSYNGTSSMTITDSDITIASAAGAYSADSLTLVGDVNILTKSNRQVLLSDSIDTDELTDDAVIQGYSRQGNDMFYFTDYTLTSEFSVITGRTLTIPEGVTLTLADDVTLSSEDEGAIINNGTIIVPCTSTGGVADGSLSTESNSVVSEHSYNYENIVWDYNNATATVTCLICGESITVDATITSTNHLGVVTWTAKATINGVEYTSTQTTGTSLLNVQANYAAVTAAISKANALNASDYVDFSGVTAAINAVNWNLNVLNQSVVNSYAEAIETAIANLVPVDNTGVEIDEPVEGTDTETEPDEEPTVEENPTTGIVITLLPMAIAIATAVANKQKLR
ncbi:MAG: hypothetical protein LUG86_03210 [Oscillospiraceae bacterium]|nr:hypothetical protein [Oscillospiraceae bacterium]